MIFLWSLFTRQPQRRSFALLDAAGICRGLHQGIERPASGNWVEVRETRLAWLDQPLPASARVAPVVGQPARRRALAA
ncbi:hypothetical protein [Pseudomonas sp. TCU-HL1]|uniref:hypothetical protein n=1 Tax=Pseudomonas sp. TCU-HL1 TaxID=1856685 RepID=UPI0008564139|nr:hypothetical protein [Pseudomonas sp. TCU-HL1]AOE87360.1 hypothetical protein THL1_4812 [Pseudomonas sp. TCU-HL1]